MRIGRYRLEFFRPPNPQAAHLRGVAHLDRDISAVLPYLNTVLGGHQYSQAPPALTLKFEGKLITLYGRQIAINIVKDEEEADKILNWLQREIKETWESRADIEPSFEIANKPRILEILKFLPKTNCKECGQPTCMVFAVQVREGVKGPDDCPPLDKQNKLRLQEYLKHFRFIK